MSVEDAECTVAEAADWFKVSTATVRSWVARYGIASVGGRAKNAKVYRFTDLVAAHRRARGLPPMEGRGDEAFGATADR